MQYPRVLYRCAVGAREDPDSLPQTFISGLLKPKGEVRVALSQGRKVDFRVFLFVNWLVVLRAVGRGG